MKKLLVIFSLFILNKNDSMAQAGSKKLNDKFVLVIHSGAGTILKSQMTPEREKAYTKALNIALVVLLEAIK